MKCTGVKASPSSSTGSLGANEPSKAWMPSSEVKGMYTIRGKSSGAGGKKGTREWGGRRGKRCHIRPRYRFISPMVQFIQGSSVGVNAKKEGTRESQRGATRPQQPGSSTASASMHVPSKGRAVVHLIRNLILFQARHSNWSEACTGRTYPDEKATRSGRIGRSFQKDNSKTERPAKPTRRE